MKYYTLERLGAHNPHRWIKSWPYIKDVSFSKGKQIPAEVANVIDEDYFNIEIKSNTKVRTVYPPIARMDAYIVVNEAMKEFLLAKGYTKIDFMEMDEVATGI
jgi:hypothetical protein